jgi:hypothetical protein
MPTTHWTGEVTATHVAATHWTGEVTAAHWTSEVTATHVAAETTHVAATAAETSAATTVTSVRLLHCGRSKKQAACKSSNCNYSRFHDEPPKLRL